MKTRSIIRYIWQTTTCVVIAFALIYFTKNRPQSPNYLREATELLSESERDLLQAEIDKVGTKYRQKYTDMQLSGHANSTEATRQLAGLRQIFSDTAYKNTNILLDDRSLAKSLVDRTITESQNCTFDFQCSIVSFECPFGCGGTGLRTSKIKGVKEAVSDYHQEYGTCWYSCGFDFPGNVSCVDNKCKVQY